MVESNDEDPSCTLRGETRPILDGDNNNNNNNNKGKLRITFALCLSFFCLGLSAVIIGPTLLSLAEKLDTSLPKISQVFTASSLGAVLGAAVGGAIIDRFNPLLLIGMCLWVFGVGVIALPFLPSVGALAIVSGIVGITMGFLDTSANLMILRLWGKKRAPVILQALHFSIALGAFISPLVVAPFLAPIPLTIPKCTPMTLATVASTSGSKTVPTVTYTTNSYRVQGEAITKKPSRSRWREILEGERGIILETSYDKSKGSEDFEREKRHPDALYTAYEETTLPTTISVDSDQAEIDVGKQSPDPQAARTISQFSERSSNSNKLISDEEYPHPKSESSANFTNSMDGKSTPPSYQRVPDSSAMDNNGLQCQDDRFEIGYIIIGTLVLVSSFIFFFLLYTAPKDESLANGEDKSENNEESGTRFRNRILGLLFIFYVLYIGGEVAYGGYVATFAVESNLHFHKDEASKVVALFWGMFALGRGVAIGVASLFSPLQMVIADVVGCLITTVMLSCFAEKHAAVLWIGSALLGLSMASLFPSGIAWLQSFTEVTGNATSLLIVGGALGQTITPFLVGFLMDPNTAPNLGPMVLMYLMLTVSVLASLTFFFVWWLASKSGEKRESLPEDENPAAELFRTIKEALPMQNIAFHED